MSGSDVEAPVSRSGVERGLGWSGVLKVTTTPRMVGRCELFAELAQGGMATIHLGRWVGAGGFAKTVAVKALHRQYARDPEFVRMFLDEARVVASIRHPNVTPTIDLVEEDGELFIVMEYVEGATLAHVMRKAQEAGEHLPVGVALRTMTGVLQGLHAAHEARNERGEPMCVIHRDVSPENILVGVDGYARLIDFGIATALGRSSQTLDGQLKGKLAYLSPEQVLGNRLTRRADLFSASVVLWQALTGRMLFKSTNLVEAAHKILTLPIEAPSTVSSRVPKALDSIVLRGLSRDPEERWPSAEQMAEALKAIGPVATHGEVGAFVRRVARERLAARAQATRAMAGAPVEVERSVLERPLSIRPAAREALAEEVLGPIVAIEGLGIDEFVTDVTTVGGGRKRPNLVVRARPSHVRAYVAMAVAGLGVAGLVGWALSRATGPALETDERAVPAASPSSSAPLLPSSERAVPGSSLAAIPSGAATVDAAAPTDDAGGDDADAAAATGTGPAIGSGRVPTGPWTAPTRTRKPYVPGDI